MQSKKRRISHDDDVADDDVIEEAPKSKREEVMKNRMAFEQARIAKMKHLEEKELQVQQQKTELDALKGILQVGGNSQQDVVMVSPTKSDKKDDDHLIEQMLENVRNCNSNNLKNIAKLLSLQLNENQVLLNINGTKFKVGKQSLGRTGMQKFIFQFFV